MQRVRMSLPYYKMFGWEPTIVTVGEEYADLIKDNLLSASISEDINIYKVKALSKKLTTKIGLGSIALRSIWYYKKFVDDLLKKERFDLIFFSTTQFPVMILGAHWKKKFNIPYVIDMQDPWHTDYYKDKPKAERPAKYWFSYRLNKWLEPIAMKKLDGLMSVSQNYIDVLKNRYQNLRNKPAATITFGAFDIDFDLAQANEQLFKLAFTASKNTINIVYVGRGGHDMQQSLTILFEAFKTGLIDNPQLFSQVRFTFIGTSYAAKGKGIPTIIPLAQTFGLATYVTEITYRIGFYESIHQLKKADGLMILGSDQAAYTASKLYPYILAKKPLLAVFHPQSSVTAILKQCNAGDLLTLTATNQEAYSVLSTYLTAVKNKEIPQTNWENFEPYTAKYLTNQQTNLFDQVINA